MEVSTLLTLVLMACSTYFTRVIGYLLLRGRTLSPRMQYVMESLPGCVLISVIAPACVAQVKGRGFAGYCDALDILLEGVTERLGEGYENRYKSGQVIMAGRDYRDE